MLKHGKTQALVHILFPGIGQLDVVCWNVFI